jgi:hypothetical protein
LQLAHFAANSKERENPGRIKIAIAPQRSAELPYLRPDLLQRDLGPAADPDGQVALIGHGIAVVVDGEEGHLLIRSGTVHVFLHKPYFTISDMLAGEPERLIKPEVNFYSFLNLY